MNNNPRVSRVVTRAVHDQRRRVQMVEREMRRINAADPTAGDLDPDTLARTYPRLLELMRKAALAEARAVILTRREEARLARVAGAPDPVARHTALPPAAPPPRFNMLTARCEGCGCSWANCCVGGCEILEAYSSVHRYVCSRCVGKVSPP